MGGWEGGGAVGGGFKCFLYLYGAAEALAFGAHDRRLFVRMLQRGCG